VGSCIHGLPIRGGSKGPCLKGVQSHTKNKYIYIYILKKKCYPTNLQMKKGTSITSNPPKTISANSTSIRIVKTIRTFETDCN
jgi:hypothetical protein